MLLPVLAAASVAACPATAGFAAVNRADVLTGADMVVRTGQRLLWNVSGVSELHTLTVMAGGSLIFADDVGPITVAAARIMVAGTLTAGAPGCPHLSPLTIRLTGAPNSTDSIVLPPLPGNTSKMLAVLPGGRLDLHGATGRRSWLRLRSTTPAGGKVLCVDDVDHGWQAGDRLAVATSGFSPADAQNVTVEAVQPGGCFSITERLRVQKYGGAPAKRRELNTEVALLSRNVVVEGANEELQPCPSLNVRDAHPQRWQPWWHCYGGHTVFMRNTTVRISGTEFRGMGQANTLARYPLHWHMPGPAEGSYFANSSVHDGFQRCVTLHGVFGLTVSDIACVRTRGHGYFLEDAIEHGNVLRRNLAMNIEQGPLLCTDNAVGLEKGLAFAGSSPARGPGGFWITNPNNTLEDNVAVGIGGKQHGFGFWFALPLKVFDPSSGYLRIHAKELGIGDWVFKQSPSHMDLDFRRNVAKGCFHGIQADGLLAQSEPSSKPDGATCAPQGTAVNRGHLRIEECVMAKNRRGLWLDGMDFELTGNLFADNGAGVLLEDLDYFHGQKLYADNAFVGETDNQYAEKERVFCTHELAPTPGDCSAYAIRGIEVYDGPLCIIGTRYANFTNDGTRAASLFDTFDTPADYVNPFFVWPLEPLGETPGDAFTFSTTALDPAGQWLNVSEMIGLQTAVLYQVPKNGTSRPLVNSIVPGSSLLVDPERCVAGKGNTFRCFGPHYSRLQIVYSDSMTPGGPTRWSWWRTDNPAWTTTFVEPIANVNLIADECVVGVSEGFMQLTPGDVSIQLIGFWPQLGQAIRGAMYVGNATINACMISNCTIGGDVWKQTGGVRSAANVTGGWLYFTLVSVPPLRHDNALTMTLSLHVNNQKNQTQPAPSDAPSHCPPWPSQLPDDWVSQWCPSMPAPGPNRFVD